ncbi:MAG: hypothetical protein A4E65_03733 [Syntrophorhabdus sp. PtaU1.Bin153]|nr:MAG: hypothetical protein A4E65_03733 [Syntrophorhabdus sp. PtaU1.Bin153]
MLRVPDVRRQHYLPPLDKATTGAFQRTIAAPNDKIVIHRRYGHNIESVITLGNTVADESFNKGLQLVFPDIFKLIPVGINEWNPLLETDADVIFQFVKGIP